MNWFSRDHTGRRLSNHEHAFLADLTRMLDEVHPPQLLPEETALTAEGPACLIVLMPHRALGGVSIVVWLHADKAAVSWAQVGGLGCCHDSLDAGLWIADHPLPPTAPQFGAVTACVREELARRITVRRYPTPARAVVLVRNSKDRLREVGKMGHAVPWFRRLWQGSPEQEVEVSFMGQAAPPISQASGVADWFVSGH